MNSYIEHYRAGDVGVVRLQHPPVNLLTGPVHAALLEALETLNADPEVRGLIIIGAGRVFSAGADITEFQCRDGTEMFRANDPWRVAAMIEKMPKPVVAAMHGSALGAGLELALSCHYRVAAPNTELGLPEINLGLLPGGGGTQRLPRLIGATAAWEMMLSGRSIDARRAQSCSLLDAIIEGDLLEGAIRFLNEVLAKGLTLRRTRDQSLTASEVSPDFVARARSEAQAKRAHSFAANRIVDCIEAAARLPFDAGLRFEREQFLACNATATAKALQHSFFAQRNARKIPHIPSGTRERKIDRVAVIGGGTMGRGIAMAFANADYPVTVIEADAARADEAKQAIDREYQRQQASGRLTADQAASRVSAVAVTTSYEAVEVSDLVIEAVFENLDIKKDLCTRLGRLCKAGAIIASNTSSLDINALARASGRPSDFLGLHFFSPAHVMKLLEIVRGDATAADVLATALTLSRRLGKHAVVCGVCFGFVGNRMLEPYLREAEAMLLEGATPRQIDQALETFGMSMGPCRMLDLAGVDVAAKVVAERAKQGSLPPDPLYRIVCRGLERVGRFGQKSGAGFYKYEGRRAIDDPEAVALIRQLAQSRNAPARLNISAEEILERCMLPLINEGFKILEEGIAYRSSDLDVVWTSGYGFPADRGGPMFYAGQLGLSHVRDRLLHYARLRGDPFGYWRFAGELT